MTSNTNRPVLKKSSLSPKPFIYAGFATIAVTFGAFGGWAATAPLASAVVASGVVSVESNRKTIQHLEGGIVAEILVKESQLVEQDQILARLIPVQAKANRGIYSTRHAVLKATEARLEAERTDAESIVFPEFLLQEKSDEIVYALNTQRNLFRDRRAVKEGQIKILNSRIEQLNQEITGLEVQRDAVFSQQESMDEELVRLRSGATGGFVQKNQLSQMERDSSVLKGNYGRLVSELAKTKQSIVETQLQILQIGQEFRERAANESKEMRAELNEVTERLVIAEDIMARTIIRAPIKGIVQNIKFHTSGGVVRPAETIMEIVPTNEKLVINAQVRPLDIDSIDLNDPAEVRFPAFSSRTIPLIEGNVKSISPDLIYPESGRGDPYYLARIEVEDVRVPDEIKGRIIPGMPSDVIIATGERTMFNYLIRPLEDAIAKSMKEE